MARVPGKDNSISGELEVQPLPLSYDLFILGTTVYAWIVTVGIILPTNPSNESILLWSDLLACVVLLIDFLIILARSPSKVGYFVRAGGWLDLLGSIPAVPGLPWTVLFRLTRSNRFIRIVRQLRGKNGDPVVVQSRRTRAGTVLLSTVLFALVLLTVASLVILRFERGASDVSITNGATAFWWAFVTMTTVGYGDYVPVTHAGRILAIGLMTFGIGIFAVLTSFMASKFLIHTDDQVDLINVLKEENVAIRADLAELKELIRQQGETDG